MIYIYACICTQLNDNDDNDKDAYAIHYFTIKIHKITDFEKE